MTYENYDPVDRYLWLSKDTQNYLFLRKNLLYRYFYYYVFLWGISLCLHNRTLMCRDCDCIVSLLTITQTFVRRWNTRPLWMLFNHPEVIGILPVWPIVVSFGRTEELYILVTETRPLFMGFDFENYYDKPITPLSLHIPFSPFSCPNLWVLRLRKKLY